MPNRLAPAGGVAELTDGDADGLLGSAVEAMGGALLDWSATQVDDRPGTSTTVAYRARVRWPTGERTETLGARLSSRPLPADDPDGVVRMSDGVRNVQVWRFPADPALPGLAAVMTEHGAAGVLEAIGADGRDARARILGYRPCRRAVIEVSGRHHRVFVKVLRPHTVAGVHERLVRCREAGLPTPRSLGWTDDGLLVLEPLAGHGLRDEIGRRGRSACPPEELTSLLDRLPAELVALPRRAAWSEFADHFAAVIGSAAPVLADRAAAIAGAVAAMLDTEPDDGPSHGDFYEAQLLADGGRITGMLDIDTAGPGRRVDDLACLIGHLSVLITMSRSGRERIRDALTGWTPHFDLLVDSRQLRVRAAGVVLSLATGPFRTREPQPAQSATARLAMAEAWLDAAASGRPLNLENPLIGTSAPAHRR